MSSSPAQLAAKLERFAGALADNGAALNATGMAGKKIFEAAAGPAIGARVAGKRKAIGARYNVRTRKAGGSVMVMYTGPAHLLNNRTRPHFIAARRLGSRKGLAGKAQGIGAVAAFGGSNRGAFGGLRGGRGAQALTIGPNLRAYAFHPGTRGKAFYPRARAAAERALPQIYARAQVTEPMRGIF